MAQLVYTDPGSMNKLIDFWDQPTAPNPDGSTGNVALFISGVPAKIESLWALTQARKLPQQVLTETSHRITILYMKGLRARMFVLYNDPDTDGPRRFDIDSINDPDEQKHELQILAIERNDGQ
jgi:head-tail adaptor